MGKGSENPRIPEWVAWKGLKDDPIPQAGTLPLSQPWAFPGMEFDGNSPYPK